MYTFNQTTFQSQGESFKTPWTIDLDGINESETCEFKDLMIEAGEQAEPFKMVPFMADMAAAVKQDDAARTALVEQYCKANNVVRHVGAIRKGLGMSSKIRATGKKECAEFSRRAANRDRLDPHELMDIKADRVEREVSKGREALRQIA